MSAEATARLLSRVEKNLATLVNSPHANRCIECGHVRHNELGYCQVGQCICGSGTTFSGLAGIVRRDLRAALAASDDTEGGER